MGNLWQKIWANWLFRRSVFYCRARNYKKALKLIERARALFPKNDVFLLSEAVSTGLGGNYKRAYDQFSEACDMLQQSKRREADNQYLLSYAAYGKSVYAVKSRGGVVDGELLGEPFKKLDLANVSRKWMEFFSARFTRQFDVLPECCPQAPLTAPINRKALRDIFLLPPICGIVSFYLHGNPEQILLAIPFGWVLSFVFFRDRFWGSIPLPAMLLIIALGIYWVGTGEFDDFERQAITAAGISSSFGALLAIMRVSWNILTNVIGATVIIALSVLASGVEGLLIILAICIVVGLFDRKSKQFPARHLKASRHYPLAGYLAYSVMLFLFFLDPRLFS